ncbi:MAG: DUF1499 domain-containing protein [Alphaproteobacteria bacterium]
MHRALTSRLALLSLGLGFCSLALVALSALGYRQGWWPVLPALSVFEWAVWSALAGLATAGAAGVHWLRRRRGGSVLVLTGMLSCLPVLAMAAHWEYATLNAPPINDISTDTQDPPVFWDMPNPTDYPSRNAEVQRGAYPGAVPLEVARPAKEVFVLALDLVRARGWKVIAEAPDEGRIEAEARSLLYGFVDEVAVRITEMENGARVDMRSRSRLGRIDRGVNARRIEIFLADLKDRGKP